MKKIYGLLIAGVLGAALVGCGDKGGDTGTTTGGAAATTTGTATPDAGTAGATTTTGSTTADAGTAGATTTAGTADSAGAPGAAKAGDKPTAPKTTA